MSKHAINIGGKKAKITDDSLTLYPRFVMVVKVMIRWKKRNQRKKYVEWKTSVSQ